MKSNGRIFWNFYILILFSHLRKNRMSSHVRLINGNSWKIFFFIAPCVLLNSFICWENSVSGDILGVKLFLMKRNNVEREQQLLQKK